MRDYYHASNCSWVRDCPDKSLWNLNNLMDGPAVQYSTMILRSERKIDTKRQNTSGRKCFSNLKAHIKSQQNLPHMETIFEIYSKQRRADYTFTTTGTCFSIFAACEHQHVLECKTRGMSALWNECHWASYRALRKSHNTLFSKQPTFIVWQQYSVNLHRRNEDYMKRRYEYSINGTATEIRTWSE